MSGHASAALHRSARRLDDSADRLQQSTLTRAIGADEPDRRASVDVDVDVPQCPEVLFIPRSPTEVDNSLFDAVVLTHDKAL